MTKHLEIMWNCPKGHENTDYDNPLPLAAYCEECNTDYPWPDVREIHSKGFVYD